VNSRITSPSGRVEPGHRPEFEEITVVLAGALRVEYEGAAVDVSPDTVHRDV
jgi:quercetin dioxygenase-like cupin family protein